MTFKSAVFLPAIAFSVVVHAAIIEGDGQPATAPASKQEGDGSWKSVDRALQIIDDVKQAVVLGTTRTATDPQHPLVMVVPLKDLSDHAKTMMRDFVLHSWNLFSRSIKDDKDLHYIREPRKDLVVFIKNGESYQPTSFDFLIEKETGFFNYSKFIEYLKFRGFRDLYEKVGDSYARITDKAGFIAEDDGSPESPNAFKYLNQDGDEIDLKLVDYASIRNSARAEVEPLIPDRFTHPLESISKLRTTFQIVYQSAQRDLPELKKMSQKSTYATLSVAMVTLAGGYYLLVEAPAKTFAALGATILREGLGGIDSVLHTATVFKNGLRVVRDAVPSFLMLTPVAVYSVLSSVAAGLFVGVREVSDAVYLTSLLKTIKEKGPVVVKDLKKGLEDFLNSLPEKLDVATDKLIEGSQKLAKATREEAIQTTRRTVQIGRDMKQAAVNGTIKTPEGEEAPLTIVLPLNDIPVAGAAFKKRMIPAWDIFKRTIKNDVEVAFIREPREGLVAFTKDGDSFRPLHLDGFVSSATGLFDFLAFKNFLKARGASEIYEKLDDGYVKIQDEAAFITGDYGFLDELAERFKAAAHDDAPLKDRVQRAQDHAARSKFLNKKGQVIDSGFFDFGFVNQASREFTQWTIPAKLRDSPVRLLKDLPTAVRTDVELRTAQYHTLVADRSSGRASKMAFASVYSLAVAGRTGLFILQIPASALARLVSPVTRLVSLGVLGLAQTGFVANAAGDLTAEAVGAGAFRLAAESLYSVFSSVLAGLAVGAYRVGDAIYLNQALRLTSDGIIYAIEKGPTKARRAYDYVEYGKEEGIGSWIEGSKQNEVVADLVESLNAQKQTLGFDRLEVKSKGLTTRITLYKTVGGQIEVNTALVTVQPREKWAPTPGVKWGYYAGSLAMNYRGTEKMKTSLNTVLQDIRLKHDELARKCIELFNNL